MKSESKMKLLLIFVFTLTVGGTLIPHKNEKQEEEKIEETQENAVTTISLTGDLLWEQGLYDWMNNYDFNGYFDEIKPYLNSDLTIGNQEVPIGGNELGVSGVAYTFNAPYAIARQLPEVGFDFVTLANNHTMDMNDKGIENTSKILDKYNVGHTGAYTSKEDSENIRVVDVNGNKIAILAYTYGTNIPANNEYQVPYFLNENGEFDEECENRIKADIEKAHEKADFVFVAMHWGLEFQYDLTFEQENVAAFLNEQNVDVVIGNHPHCIQPATTLENEEGKKTYVFYSLGNLVSSAAMVDRASSDFQNMYEIGAIVNLEIKDKKIGNIHIIPVVNHFEYDYQNFKLIPFKDYDDEMAQNHFQRYYNEDFNIDWLSEEIHYVFDDSNFKLDM